MQTSENFLPSVTGQDLGSSSQRWDAYVQTLSLDSISSTLTIEAAEPRIVLSESDQASNEKVWDLDLTGADVSIRTRTDADGAGVTAITLNRGTGTAITSIQLNPGSEDIDVTISSDTNANHFISDAGLFSGAGAFGFGAAAANFVYVNENAPALTAPANSNFARHWIQSTNSITIPSGTASVVGTFLLDEPNITATGTVTDAYTLIILGAPTEATRNGALWVSSGTARFDGAINAGGATPKFTINTSGAITKLNNVSTPTTAFTQTYSTADRTNANPTGATLTLADGAGSPDNTIGAITADSSVIAAFQEVVDEINKLIADVADTKQLCNSMIDDLQSLGIFQ